MDGPLRGAAIALRAIIARTTIEKKCLNNILDCADGDSDGIAPNLSVGEVNYECSGPGRPGNSEEVADRTSISGLVSLGARGRDGLRRRRELSVAWAADAARR